MLHALSIRSATWVIVLLAAALAALATAPASTSTPSAGCSLRGTGVAAPTAKGDLYYTRFGAADNLKRLAFTYDGKTLLLAKPELIGKGVPRADGLLFAPDGDILVGGVSDVVYKVDPRTGKYVSRKAGGVAADHLALAPDGGSVYTTGIPGPIGELPLVPFADGTRRDLTGDDRAITGIAFDACKNGYYTSSGSGGRGYFGRLNIDGFTTKRLIKAVVPAAHGLAYDPFTGDIMLFGDGHITQFDTATQRFVSDLKVDGVTLDQGSADGQGHLFVADNGGNLVFVDYSRTRLVGDRRNVVSKQFVESTLDDFAPLSGLGALEPPDPIPGRAVNVEASQGQVRVRPPGSARFTAVDHASQIPTGSEIDATRGRVRLTTAAPGGKTQSAVFYGGRFVVRQPGGVRLPTELTLAGPLRRPGAGRPAERHLWADGKGRFRINGRYASATARGTRWLTQDLAGGTLVRVQSGTVEVLDRKRKKRYLVKAHRSHFVRR